MICRRTVRARKVQPVSLVERADLWAGHEKDDATDCAHAAHAHNLERKVLNLEMIQQPAMFLAQRIPITGECFLKVGQMFRVAFFPEDERLGADHP